MRIAFIGNGLFATDQYPFPRVGGSVQTWGVAKELAKRGHEVSIIRRSIVEEEFVEKVRLVGINFRGADDLFSPYSLAHYFGNLITALRFSKKCMKELAEYKPEIIYLIKRATAVYPSRSITAKVYIMHHPDALDFYKPYSIHSNILNSLAFLFKKRLEAGILKKSNIIVALNTYIQKYLESMGYENTEYIPNGIDLNEFSNQGDGGYILFAGRFDWNKNVESLVKAFAGALENYPSSKLHLVGEGPEAPKLHYLIEKMGLTESVRMVPWMPRAALARMMGQCSFVVLPSFFEIFPVVALEAMASAKPVIARTNMGSSEIINHRTNGILYKNKRELQKYLELLLSDPELRKSMGRRARRTVEENYTFSTISGRYERLQDSLLGG
jgi:glycosyltransferase involved in cell wall biosynthesis